MIFVFIALCVILTGMMLLMCMETDEKADLAKFNKDVAYWQKENRRHS